MKFKDHKGTEWRTKRDMVNHYNIPYQTFKYRMRHGWSLKDALETEPENPGEPIPARDHLGKDYPSMTARLKSGRSIEETLTMKGRVCDHEGRWFTSHKAMCEYHKVNYETYLARKEKNWTIKERLTGVKENIMEHIKCKDHEGNVFPSLKDMCEHHNVSYALFRYRIRHGASLKTALTEPEGYECEDHLGNKFANKTEMCNEPVDDRRKK